MIPAEWLIHTASVETYQGRTGAGAELYAAPADVACFVEQRIRKVRAATGDGSTGDEVVSSATLYANPEALASFTPESRVTLPAALGGRATWVIEAAPRDDGGLLGLAHLEVVLA